MNSDDWQVLGDKAVVLICAAAALLYAIGVIA